MLKFLKYTMKQQKDTVCDICEKQSAVLFWDVRYNGYRGACSSCEGNWPES